MKTVGLTGGMGSGKSTVARLWQNAGAYVVFADELARDLMVSNADLKKRLIKAFGNSTYLEDGSLNKPHLIKEAFQSGRVEELNSLVHPVVQEETMRLAEKANRDGFPLFIKEAALLLNNGRPAHFDYIVLVDADFEIRLNRVIQRDNTDRESVIQRMHKQPDFSKLTDLCDIVIMNNGSVQELESEARRVFKELVDS